MTLNCIVKDTLAMVAFEYQWEIPVWMHFEQNVIWDLSRIDIIIPTTSQMLVDVILSHRQQNITIFLSNLKDELFYALANNIQLALI